MRRLIPALALLALGATDAQQKAEVYEILGTDAITVAFAPGSAELTAEDRASLKGLVEKAKATGHGGDVLVAAWSDKDYPAKGKKLSAADRKLAKERDDAIVQELKRDGAGKVKSYSFAEHPSWVSQVFHSEGAAVRGKGDVGDELRDKGGPSTAVVLLH